MTTVQKKPYQWLAWSATVLLVFNAMLAALNVYPLFVWGFILANMVWFVIGLLWKEPSLVWMNLGLTVIYLFGLWLKAVGMV